MSGFENLVNLKWYKTYDVLWHLTPKFENLVNLKWYKTLMYPWERRATV